MEIVLGQTSGGFESHGSARYALYSRELKGAMRGWQESTLG